MKTLKTNKMKNDDENRKAGSDCHERLIRHLIDEAKRITGCDDIDSERMTATGIKAIYDMEEHRIKSHALLDAALKAGMECAIHRPADTSSHQEIIQAAMDFFLPNANMEAPNA